MSEMGHTGVEAIGGAIGLPNEVAVFVGDYFRQWSTFTCHYKDHNAALKWWRQWGESRGLTFVVFPTNRPISVPVTEHPKGMDYCIGSPTRVIGNTGFGRKWLPS